MDERVKISSEMGELLAQGCNCGNDHLIPTNFSGGKEGRGTKTCDKPEGP